MSEVESKPAREENLNAEDDDNYQHHDEPRDEFKMSMTENLTSEESEHDETKKRCCSKDGLVGAAISWLADVVWNRMFELLFFLFIVTQEMNDTSHLVKLNMMVRYEDKTILVASFISPVVVNLVIIFSAYLIRGHLLTHIEAQIITLSCFFFICGYELLVHTLN